MKLRNQGFGILAAAVVLCLPASAAGKKRSNVPVESTGGGSALIEGSAVMWSDPGNVASRNLYYGPGGKEHSPAGRFTFEKEDLDGSNPKFVVRDDQNVKWKVKLGAEARPETVAARLVWAVGYPANEDYFVPELHVREMPAHLKRGQNLVLPGGVVRDVRLKRYLKGEEKVGTWKWRDDPFVDTREYNGLRVMMALVNNWDLKDVNNSIYREKGGRNVYMVSDLGASFGTDHPTWPHAKAKGNLNSYQHSSFIDGADEQFVSFRDPGRPSFKYWILPVQCVSRWRLHWIGRDIPRADARWIGGLLARLTPKQIEDAFRAAGYSPEEVAGFSKIVEQRIAELKAL